MTGARVAARFGPGPFSLEGVAQAIRALGEVDGNDLRPLAAKLGVSEDSFHIKAVADILGISDEPRELPELYSAMRRLLRAVAPVTVVFDDVGAAGPAFFNLLGYLEESLEDERVIIELRGDPAAPYPMIGTGDELMEAGIRSLRRSDMPAADAFLAAAADLLPQGEARYRCVAARCDALLAGGRPSHAFEVARIGLRDAVSEGNDHYRARFSFFTTLLGEGSDDLGTELTHIASVLVEHRDGAGAAQAIEAHAHLLWDTGATSASLDLMDEALGHARNARDIQTATRIVAWICDVVGSGVVDEAPSRERIEDLSWVAESSPLVEVKRMATLAQLTARAGSIPTARSLIEAAISLQEDLGQPGSVSGVPEVAGEIDRLAEARLPQTIRAEDV